MIGTVPSIRTIYVPVGNKNRPRIALKPTTLTIHNTANKKSTAKNERDFVCSPSNTRTASFHWVVDQQEAINVIPENEVAWHAGNNTGNHSSIGMEVCESGDQAIVWKNAVGLAALILHNHGWGVDRLRKHQDWSGKYCPRMIIPVWGQFVADVQETLNSLNNPKPVVKVEEWMKKPIKDLFDKGILSEYDGWAKKAADATPVWAATTITANTYKLLAHDQSNLKDKNWKLDGINTLFNAKILVDKTGWTTKIDEAMPVCSFTALIANLLKALLPELKAERTNDWKRDSIVYLNKAGVLDDLNGWIAKQDESIPVWAVCTILDDVHKKVSGGK